MYFRHQLHVPGSVTASLAFFAYCEDKLKSLIPFYSGPINPYQRLRYFRFNPDPEPDYTGRIEFNEPLSELYFEGKNVYQVINCSFPEFCQALLFGNHLYPNRQYFPGFSRPDKVPSKYVRQSHHHPKILSEQDQARKDWRERKGFTKDYRRRSRSYRGRCKKIRKFFDNKQHRAWEKDCLHHERFDELMNGTNKAIFDPWKID